MKQTLIFFPQFSYYLYLLGMVAVPFAYTIFMAEQNRRILNNYSLFTIALFAINFIRAQAENIRLSVSISFRMNILHTTSSYLHNRQF